MRDIHHTDKGKLGISHYELTDDRIRNHGRIYLGHSFDVNFRLDDLRTETQEFAIRPAGFAGYLNLTALFMIGSVICWPFRDDEAMLNVLFLLVTMMACMGIGVLWSLPKVPVRYILLKDYRKAFGVRICAENADFIRLLDEAIRNPRA